MKISQIKLKLFWTFLFAFVNIGYAAEKIPSVQADTSYYKRNPVYSFETSMHKLNKLKNPDIVMFGDSHIQGAHWNELLGNYKIINRGIAGDDTEGMKNRLPEIIKLRPALVIFEGGVNDVYNWVPEKIILGNINFIVKTLKASNINVIVNSIFYAGKYWGKSWIEKNSPEINVVKYNEERNRVIKSINKKLREICNKNNVIFVDVNSKLSRGMFLQEKYTRDQLHLNARGYKIWVRELIKVIEKQKNRRSKWKK